MTGVRARGSEQSTADRGRAVPSFTLSKGAVRSSNHAGPTIVSFPQLRLSSVNKVDCLCLCVELSLGAAGIKGSGAICEILYPA